MNVFAEDIIKEREKHIEEIKENRSNPFEIINELFNLVWCSDYKNAKYDIIKNKICKILEKDKDDNLSFIVWLLIHYSCYNSYTRKLIDTISKVSYSLQSKEFIIWYIYFCIYNNFILPKYMYFYKFSLNNFKKYKSYILDNYDLSDEEYEDLKKYFNYSDKDMYYIFKYIKKGQ